MIRLISPVQDYVNFINSFDDDVGEDKIFDELDNRTLSELYEHFYRQKLQTVHGLRLYRFFCSIISQIATRRNFYLSKEQSIDFSIPSFSNRLEKK